MFNESFQGSDDIKGIRAEPKTFSQLILNQLDRILQYLPKAVRESGGLDKYNVAAAKYLLSGLHVLIQTRGDGGYLNKYKEISKQFNDNLLDRKDARQDFLDLLNDWLALEISQFPKFNLIPPEQKTFEFEQAPWEKIGEGL